MLRLFDSPLSGNCYKIRLLLAHLERPYERVEVDVLARDHRPLALRQRNLWGRVPVLELEDGRSIAESNAILWHVARGTRYLSEDPYEQTQTLQWLFFEQNSHEPTIAVARYLVSILRQPEKHAARLEYLRRTGQAALRAMEEHLADHEFFVADSYSIADISLYAYTHVAPEGGFSLERFPAVREWLARVREQPGHVPLL